MFEKTSLFEIVEEPKGELEQLQSQWLKALSEGFQSRLIKVLKLKQDGRERLFYVMNEHSTVESLKTTLKARTLRDDLAVVDLEITYTTIPNLGTKQEAKFNLLNDPKTVGVDPEETVRLVNRIVSGSNP